MTVAELRAALAGLPAEAEGWTVVLRDYGNPGPNCYHPVAGMTAGRYVRWNEVRGAFFGAADLYVPTGLYLWPHVASERERPSSTQE